MFTLRNCLQLPSKTLKIKKQNINTQKNSLGGEIWKNKKDERSESDETQKDHTFYNNCLDSPIKKMHTGGQNKEKLAKKKKRKKMT